MEKLFTQVPAALAEPAARVLGPLLQVSEPQQRAVVQPAAATARQGSSGAGAGVAGAAAAAGGPGGGVRSGRAAVGQRSGAARAAASREGLEQLVSMGFSEAAARCAWMHASHVAHARSACKRRGCC